MTGGMVLNIQRSSVHDGPGIRTTVFLKGCPLRCAWCHNPESQEAAPQLMVAGERCIRCGACEGACPTGAAGGVGACEACGLCAEACPTGARTVAGTTVTVPEILQEVLKDRDFYEGGGGVTFSGGEPLAQPDFLIGCLESCRAEGLHTALDTCGFGGQDLLLEAAALSDLVLYDVKAVDPECHLRWTGVSNETILNNLGALARAHDNIWLRIPVVPGVNDNEAEMAAMSSLAARLPGVRRVHLLPYHALGGDKAARLGRSAEGFRAASPSGETLARLAGPFKREGLAVFVGG